MTCLYLSLHLYRSWLCLLSNRRALSEPQFISPLNVHKPWFCSWSFFFHESENAATTMLSSQWPPRQITHYVIYISTLPTPRQITHYVIYISTLVAAQFSNMNEIWELKFSNMNEIWELKKHNCYYIIFCYQDRCNKIGASAPLKIGASRP